MNPPTITSTSLYTAAHHDLWEGLLKVAASPIALRDSLIEKASSIALNQSGERRRT
jgi:hypothetical protein